MSDEINEKVRIAFISYLDERNETREGYVEIIKMDQFLVQFKTNSGNIITLPLARVLKVKEKEEVSDNGKSGDSKTIIS